FLLQEAVSDNNPKIHYKQYIYEMDDKSENEINKSLKETLQQYFRPEFLNRLDDIIIFHRLNKVQIQDIVKIQLNILKKRLLERNYKLNITEKAVEQIVTMGFDPQFGARPLKRMIKKEIENKLAIEILNGKIFPSQEIIIDYDGNFIFKLN
ncbi:MAG: hypothetical protein K8S23_07245, partial [Candidatus Cloacimonetes bacterium]|nr:hypothetical protein [Candidatus Cloacimonadota bacterium]